ncbi:hypothetical protein Ocin01_02999 [Orchesella cincta]|uniref:Uncharacterized protein n=1 Tax=Orchesella cincta TaxID=48709 RepID=A0A1D2NEM6_ORCCI|nr:hypothetical protein Ocin01_02999 [Orchesella cincta]
MPRQSFFRSSAVALLILLLVSVFADYRVQIETTENPTTSESIDSTEDEQSKPWESPLQELLRIAESCTMKDPEFIQKTHTAKIIWENCMDSINPGVSTSEHSISSNEKGDSTGRSFPEIPICVNTSAFKGCWISVIAALNECEAGVGDVVGAIYFALYDDTCREGGRLTVENRRKVAEEGEPCSRNYSTPECDINTMLRNSNDLCLRFYSITACDLSSIDPNCSNEYDKRLHADIFERVGNDLQCFPSSQSNGGTDLIIGQLSTFIITVLLTAFM